MDLSSILIGHTGTGQSQCWHAQERRQALSRSFIGSQVKVPPARGSLSSPDQAASVSQPMVPKGTAHLTTFAGPALMDQALVLKLGGLDASFQCEIKGDSLTIQPPHLIGRVESHRRTMWPRGGFRLWGCPVAPFHQAGHKGLFAALWFPELCMLSG